MKTSSGASTYFRVFRSTSLRFTVLATSLALLVGGAATLVVTPAGASGTTPNTISVSASPSAGSVRGTYTPSAKATSGDNVVISLDTTSRGCTLAAGKVTFTAAGTCAIDFNDAGNTTYAAATQVRQDIKVYAENTITVSATPTDGSVGGSFSPGASATSGDTVVLSLATTSIGCGLQSGKVTFTGVGTCEVDFNDVGNGAFAAAKQERRSVKIVAANTIVPSAAPAAGTIGGTYTATAKATSGDTVAITLASGSTGCSLSNGVVTFTTNGVCVIDFNDAGNGAFTAAALVRQSIKVGTGNPIAEAALRLTSTRGRHGHPLTLTSGGGSGSGAVTYTVTAPGTAGCTIKGDLLYSARAGTCLVMATKSADSTYASAHSVATRVYIAMAPPKASRMGSAVWTNRTVMTTIVGSGFYGRPRIISNVRGTTVRVVRDSGRVLTVRVSIARGVATGTHRFTLIFSRGERTSVRYFQR